MKISTLFALASLFVAIPASAEQRPYPPAKVSYDDFKALVAEVEPHRQKRLIDLDTFLRMSQEPGAVVLDTRSEFRFERIHLKGAKHLSFTDFTQDNLRTVIPSEETVVLIYCNNNFDGNEVDFASKVALPMRPIPRDGQETPTSPKTQLKAQEKPLMLALNVPTYITLYGYGYRNVYELGELVKVSDPRVSFEGTALGKDVVAWLMVRPAPVGGTSRDIAKAEYEEYRRSQVLLITSPKILGSAIRLDGIAGLDVIRDQDDPIAWLSDRIKVTAPPESEVIQLGFDRVMPGKEATDAAKIVNAIVRAYLEEAGADARVQVIEEASP